MTEEQKKLIEEIRQQRQLNKKLGVTFEHLLSSAVFDAGAAIAIICKQQLISVEITQLSQQLEQLLSDHVTFAFSIDCLLDQLEISRPR